MSMYMSGSHALPFSKWWIQSRSEAINRRRFPSGFHPFIHTHPQPETISLAILIDAHLVAGWKLSPINGFEVVRCSSYCLFFSIPFLFFLNPQNIKGFRLFQRTANCLVCVYQNLLMQHCDR